MSLIAHTFVGLTLVFVVVVAYALIWGNLYLVRDGCNGALVGMPQNGTVHFKVFPPHYVCQYGLKHGRVVERSR